MAILNGLLIFVENESFSHSIESSEHTTEKGLPITSSIQKQPTELSIDGYIVYNGTQTATQIRSKIIDLMEQGSLITYVGSRTMKNLQIQSFDIDYSKDVTDGFAYSMQLRQVRIASKAYISKAKLKAIKNNPTLKVGARNKYKGGKLYASSTAKTYKKKNAKKSTVKITKIDSKGTYKYKIESTDGKGVKGWVKKSQLQGIA